jgi:rubrerythrin
MAIKGTATDDYRYVPGVPTTPWQLVSAAADLTKIKDARKGTEAIYFKLAAAPVGDTTLSFTSVLSVAATPTPAGAILEMKPLCGGAANCRLKFTGLSPEDSIELQYENPDAKPLALNGTSELSAEMLSGVTALRLTLTGERHRAAAWKEWNAATYISRLETKIRLDKDAVAHISENVSYLKPMSDAQMRYLTGVSADRRYLLGQLTGINEGHFSEYADTHLVLSNNATRIGYAVLNAWLKDSKGKQKIILPLPALTGRYAPNTQTSPGFITDRRKITIETPEGVKLNGKIFDCETESGGACGKFSAIKTTQTHEGNNIVLVPGEAQVRSLWLFIGEVEEGQINEPGFFTRIRFGFSHHHIFGKYPRWVFWFYFVTIIGSLVLLIVFFAKLGGIKRRRAERLRAEAAEQNAIKDILKRDPAFDVEAFKQRGRQIAEKIQHAWSAGDMRECRRYLSQGVYNRFRMQLKIMREHEKRQNAMADFKIHAFNIAARHKSGPFDSLTVRLDAEARDTMVDVNLSADDAKRAAEKAPLNGFVEYYTFMRRRDAKTEKRESIDSCSRCGTPFSGEGEITKCKSCGAVMGSGSYDWVLAEITQEVEYKGSPGKKLVGEGMSADRIEDRASFIFWRDMMTAITGKKDFLLRDATDNYLKNARAGATWKDVAVGAADLEGYDDALSPITATVRVKWSAQGPGDKEIRHRESLLYLAAKPNAEEGSGFADHSCDTCGAPLPETDAEACAYCRSPIQRKNKDWLLDRVETTVE